MRSRVVTDQCDCMVARPFLVFGGCAVLTMRKAGLCELSGQNSRISPAEPSALSPDRR